MSGARKLFFLLFVGLGGVAILVGLGVWQLSRLAEKLERIDVVRAQLEAAPLAVVGSETAAEHNFRSAAATGRFDPQTPPARYLTTVRPYGPGHRVISVFVLENGRRILVDRGFLPERLPAQARAAATTPSGAVVTLTGALHWPQEASRFTPAPNLGQRLWFARDVESIAAALDAEPVMLVAAGASSAETSAGVIATPVVVDLPNNHLSYAITWFGLAAVWAAMTFLLARGGRGGGSGET